MRIEILPAPTPAFEALVDTHTAFCDGTAPPESCHRLPVSALFTPQITVWGAFDDAALIGMGALKRLSDAEGEVKSMHTAAAARGKGTARAILARIIDTARSQGLMRISLETGVHPDFAPAVALYRAHGFADCPPFADYVPDPHSLFLSLDLTLSEVPA